MSLAEKILQGDIRSAARLMRDIDDGLRSSLEELKQLYPHTGRATSSVSPVLPAPANQPWWTS
nr:hypothetical protein [Geotalea toluenoxydans]